MIYIYFSAKFKTKSNIITQVLIVGTNERASKFTQKLLKSPSMNYNLVGFIDDYWTGLDNFDKDKFDLVGKIDDLKEILKESSY